MHFTSPCKRRIAARSADIFPDDFDVTVVATPASGNFNIAVTLKPKQHFTDIATITQSGNATVFDDAVLESNAKVDTGVNTTGTPTELTIVGAAMAQTLTNVNNTWAVVFANLVVVAKDGQSFTIASLKKTFPSPL